MRVFIVATQYTRKRYTTRHGKTLKDTYLITTTRKSRSFKRHLKF